jgi:UPF0716 protein FxsA
MTAIGDSGGETRRTRKTKRMRFLLIGILLGFPLLEVVVLVRLGEVLGWWILAWCVLAACAGVALIKEARFAMLARLAAGFAQGRFSIAAVIDSARTVIAGLFLIFPGVVSDLIAFTLLLLPGPKAIVETGSVRDTGGAVIDGEYRRTR